MARVKDMTDTAEQNSQEVVRLKRKIAETKKVTNWKNKCTCLALRRALSYSTSQMFGQTYSLKFYFTIIGKTSKL